MFCTSVVYLSWYRLILYTEGVKCWPLGGPDVGKLKGTINDAV